MVKPPVIVYNRDSQAEVILDAIDLRNKLEELAAAEYAVSKKYIRPIVLFQAEPKGKEETTTFEKICEKLIAYDIPAEQIAIRTADVNELKNTELMSADCPIRYIITVNALSEGWDCPFAYSFDIPPLFCVCWMRKRGYLRSVPARATNRRDSSSPSREANRKEK